MSHENKPTTPALEEATIFVFDAAFEEEGCVCALDEEGNLAADGPLPTPKEEATK